MNVVCRLYRTGACSAGAGTLPECNNSVGELEYEKPSAFTLIGCKNASGGFYQEWKLPLKQQKISWILLLDDFEIQFFFDDPLACNREEGDLL